MAWFVTPKDGDQTGRGSNSAEHQSKERRLSTAARPEKGVDFLVGNAERDVLQNVCLLVLEGNV